MSMIISMIISMLVSMILSCCSDLPWWCGATAADVITIARVTMIATLLPAFYNVHDLHMESDGA